MHILWRGADSCPLAKTRKGVRGEGEIAETLPAADVVMEATTQTSSDNVPRTLEMY